MFSRIRTGNVASHLSGLQPGRQQAGARNVEVFTRGLFANGDGVGMAGRRVMGSALCRRNHFGCAESSETGSADLELAASVDSPASCYRTCGRWVACGCRFSASDCFNSALCRNLSWALLGKCDMERTKSKVRKRSLVRLSLLFAPR